MAYDIGVGVGPWTDEPSVQVRWDGPPDAVFGLGIVELVARNIIGRSDAVDGDFSDDTVSSDRSQGRKGGANREEFGRHFPRTILLKERTLNGRDSDRIVQRRCLRRRDSKEGTVSDRRDTNEWNKQSCCEAMEEPEKERLYSTYARNVLYQGATAMIKGAKRGNGRFQQTDGRYGEEEPASMAVSAAEIDETGTESSVYGYLA